MKKRIVWLLVFSVIFSMILGGISVSAENYQLSGQDWQTFGGLWTVDDTGFSLVGDGPSGWPKIITNTTYQHFTIEADFVGVKEGGFVFRCGNPAVGADAFDGYFVGYDSAYAYFGVDTGRWKTLNEGGPDATSAAPLQYQERMHWKLTVSGNVFTLYVGDMNTPLIQTFDNTFDRAGGVGIRICAKAGENAGRVENIVISGIPSDKVTYNEKGTYDLWAERLLAQYPAAENQNKIIMMGDSGIEFWHNYQTDLAPYDVLNFGMGGSWVRHIADKGEMMLVPYNPKAVIIRTGGNDASGGTSSTQIVSELKEFIDHLQQILPGVPIIYVNCWSGPFILSNINNKNTRLRVNLEMEAYCQEHENVYFLATETVTTLEDSEIWLSDQMHMNALGYQKVAPLFLDLFNTIFADDAQPQDPAPTQPLSTGASQPKGSIIPWICGGIILAAAMAVAVALIPKKNKNEKENSQ